MLEVFCCSNYNSVNTTLLLMQSVLFETVCYLRKVGCSVGEFDPIVVSAVSAWTML